MNHIVQVFSLLGNQPGQIDDQDPVAAAHLDDGLIELIVDLLELPGGDLRLGLEAFHELADLVIRVGLVAVELGHEHRRDSPGPADVDEGVKVHLELIEDGVPAVSEIGETGLDHRRAGGCGAGSGGVEGIAGPAGQPGAAQHGVFPGLARVGLHRSGGALRRHLHNDAAGVIDPVKVTRTALQNAASVAMMILTTEALITDIPEKEKVPAMPPGGMGDY